MSGVLAALWLLGLLYAAPVLRNRNAPTYEFTDRLRDALILGTAIPIALALVHLLYPLALWIALLSVVALRTFVALSPSFVALSPSKGSGTPNTAIPYITIAAVALVAWPALMRPPLDGDTLSYHLPNAAAWVHAHSVWTTDARYWWYPPASESFAAGVYAVAGPFAVAWSGLAALLLLGCRIATWSRELGASPLLADALAAATVTAAPLALQGGTLQNDVWLAAFLLEMLWAIRAGDELGATVACAVTALIKPYGWIFALAGATFARSSLRVKLAGASALVLWIAHDALLWNRAIVSPASTSTANSWSTSILAHGWQGLTLLSHVLVVTSPFAFVALLGAFAGPLLAGRSARGIGWTALFTAVAFLLMPLAYADAHPQLAGGESLRFAIPAIVLGAIALAPTLSRIGHLATAALIASAIFGAGEILVVFWNDAPTRSALAVALVAAGIVYAALRVRRSGLLYMSAAIAIVASASLAARMPWNYYADALAVNGVRSGIYEWIAGTRPAAVGGWGLRLGTVNVVSPNTRTFDLPDDNACAVAAAEGGDLVAVAEPDRDAAFNAARMQSAASCGTARYRDSIAIVTSPT